ncbi:MAG: thermonuclease family protein [Candidatus Nanohaloarchaea archaeon]
MNPEKCSNSLKKSRKEVATSKSMKRLFTPENLGIIFLLTVTITAFHDDRTIQTEKTTLTKVVDGDTVNIRENGREDTIRFLGIDTPETHGQNTPGEFGLTNTTQNRLCLRTYGKKAKNYVKRKLGNQIKYTTDPSADRRGTYGRLLAYIKHGNTTLNQKLLEKGLARMYNSKFSKKEKFREIEKEAKRKEKGLWTC